jgi:hypothetical protein
MARVRSRSDTAKVLKRSRSGLSFHSWFAASSTKLKAAEVAAGVRAKAEHDPGRPLRRERDEEEEDVEEEEEEDRVVEGMEDRSVPDLGPELDSVLQGE